MKLIIVIISLLFVSNLYARDCEVFGISDSPQSLKCNFKSLNLDLSCKNGTYFLNSSRVISAFHLEVEFGAVPLVFQTRDMKLTVLMDKVGHQAELARNGRTTRLGTCL